MEDGTMNMEHRKLKLKTVAFSKDTIVPSYRQGLGDPILD
jgi:hypothetical protein